VYKTYEENASENDSPWEGEKRSKMNIYMFNFFVMFPGLNYMGNSVQKTKLRKKKFFW
jgi:hypothetical protein